MRTTWPLPLLLLLTAGCHSPLDYRVNSHRPHKDVLVYRVFLDRPAELQEYERISASELQDFVRQHRTLETSEIPLYEARFEFMKPVGEKSFQRVATVQFHLSNVSTLDTLPPPRVVLHSPAR